MFIEGLENRCLLSATVIQSGDIMVQSGDIMVVRGTDRPDSVYVWQTQKGNIGVEINGKKKYGFNISRIKISTYGGSDRIVVSKKVNTPVTIKAGGGRDFISAGSGDDTIYGGTNNDVIYGMAGKDIMTGGRGFDLFFIDKQDVITDFGLI
jgi:Ca2+-binding RTX toxin-like protein